VVSAALLHRYRGLALKYWKPVQTGIEQDDDTATVRHLAAASAERVFDGGVRLRRPVSPHLAARLNGSTIDVASLVNTFRTEPQDRGWIVEGAGGVLVPLNEGTLLIELIERLALPVLIVTRSGLGTINHTLLTIDALERRAIPIGGVVMVGIPDAENRRAIEHHSRAVVVGELPMLDPLSPHALEQWADESLDQTGRLAGFLQ
jgi:dethiobiotin synthase